MMDKVQKGRLCNFSLVMLCALLSTNDEFGNAGL